MRFESNLESLTRGRCSVVAHCSKFPYISCFFTCVVLFVPVKVPIHATNNNNQRIITGVHVRRALQLLQNLQIMKLKPDLFHVSPTARCQILHEYVSIAVLLGNKWKQVVLKRTGVLLTVSFLRDERSRRHSAD